VPQIRGWSGVGWRHLKLQGDVTICYDVDVCCCCIYFRLKGKAGENVPLLRPSSNLRWVLGWLLESLEPDGASSFAPFSSKPNAIDPPHPGESIFVFFIKAVWEEWKRQR